MGILLPVIATALIFGVMILVHEAGHLLAAKRAGMGVHEFSVGFGPALFSVTRGETKYSLRLLPLGGFVRIAGLDLEEDAPNGFDKKPLPWRFAVITLGSVMNVLLALVIFCLLGFLYGAGVVTTNDSGAVNVIASVSPGTPAQKVGLQKGDRIIAVDGRPITGVEQIRDAIKAHPGRSMRLLVMREGEVQSVVRAAGPKDEVTLVYRSGGTYAQVKTSSGRVVTSPVAVDGRAATITVAPRLEEVYKTDEKTGEPVLKNGRLVKTLTPQIGVTFLALRRPTGPVESVVNGVKGTGGTIVAFAKTIGYTVAGKIRPGLSDVEGPVRIVRRVYRAARSGLESFLWWSGFISLNIGLINLLPFPGLDGSRLAFLSVEAVRRRPVDPRKEALVHLVGIALLLLFLVVVTFREVSTLWTGASR